MLLRKLHVFNKIAGLLYGPVISRLVAYLVMVLFILPTQQGWWNMLLVILCTNRICINETMVTLILAPTSLPTLLSFSLHNIQVHYILFTISIFFEWLRFPPYHFHCPLCHFLNCRCGLVSYGFVPGCALFLLLSIV